MHFLPTDLSPGGIVNNPLKCVQFPVVDSTKFIKITHTFSCIKILYTAGDLNCFAKSSPPSFNTSTDLLLSDVQIEGDHPQKKIM